MDKLKIYKHSGDFHLESGEVLSNLEIGYHTFGIRNADDSNIIWVFHALTANSNPVEWWRGLVGSGCVIDTEKYFVICANVLGSCYGSTGPRSINPNTREPYGTSFPFYTVRDVVNAQLLLAEFLAIKRIKLAIGGSFGGYQALEMCFSRIEIEQLVLVVTSANETAWNIAIHEAQRQALLADQSFYSNNEKAGEKGLVAARGFGLISYRTREAYIATQTDDDERLDDFSASSYIKHQGEKLLARFHAHNYWYLTKCLDTHNIGRNRGGLEKALKRIEVPTLLIGIEGDQLIPPSALQFIAKHMPNSHFVRISSKYGHDGFLTETKRLTKIIKETINI